MLEITVSGTHNYSSGWVSLINRQESECSSTVFLTKADQAFTGCRKKNVLADKVLRYPSDKFYDSPIQRRSTRPVSEICVLIRSRQTTTHRSVYTSPYPINIQDAGECRYIIYSEGSRSILFELNITPTTPRPDQHS